MAKITQADVLNSAPWPPTLAEFLRVHYPTQAARLANIHACIREPASIRIAPVKPGQPALYWDGSNVMVEPFSFKRFLLQDYGTLAEKIRAVEPHCIVDLGAACGVLGASLRDQDVDMPVVSVDMLTAEVETGRRIASTYGLKDLHFLQADIGTECTQELAERIRGLAGGLPILAVTRWSLINLSENPANQARFIAWMVNDLKAARGMHMDPSGMHTATFQEVVRQCPKGLDGVLRPEWILKLPSNPFPVILAQPGVVQVERDEVYPQYLGPMSFLSWVRSGS